MSREHSEQVRAALRAIVSDPDYGSAALSSPRIMSNLLKDYLPDAPREKSVLVAAAEAGLADTLRDHISSGMDAATAMRLTASSFAASTVFQPDACEWAARELAIALGLITSDSAGSAGSPDVTLPDPVPPPPGPVPPSPVQVRAPEQVSAAPTQRAPEPPPALLTLPPAAGSPQAPAAGLPPEPAAGSPQTPAVGYPQAPAAGYPQPPAAGYPQPPAQGLPPEPEPGGAIFVPGPGQAAQPPLGLSGDRTHRRRNARTAVVLGLVAAAIAVVLVALRLTGILGSAPVEPLNTIIAPFAAQCGPSAQSFTLQGTTSSYLCRRTSSTDINVLAYQFDDAADYQAGFAALDSKTGFVALGAAGACPPPGSSTTGATGWHNSTAKYPARSGQVLQCYTDAHNHLPLLVWTLPTQRVVLLADDGATSATVSGLYDWWTTLRFG